MRALRPASTLLPTSTSPARPQWLSGLVVPISRVARSESSVAGPWIRRWRRSRLGTTPPATSRRRRDRARSPAPQAGRQLSRAAGTPARRLHRPVADGAPRAERRLAASRRGDRVFLAWLVLPGRWWRGDPRLGLGPAGTGRS